MLAAGIVESFTDWLDKTASNWWFLLIILLIAYLDSVIPVVPSETCVIIGGVAAGGADPPYSVVLVIVAGAIGAFLGDNSAYEIGRRASGRIERRAQRRPKTKKRLDFAKRQIKARGGILLVTARFIPGGRTILTLSCGVTKQKRGWFVAWVGLAACIWATYAALLGYVGGRTFKDNHTLAFLVAFGLAISVNIVIEVVRHVRNRGHSDSEPEPATT